MKRELILAVCCIAMIFVVGCGNVETTPVEKSIIESHGIASKAAIERGVPDIEEARTQIVNDSAQLGLVYSLSTTNHFDYTFGKDGKCVYMKTAYYDEVAEDQWVGSVTITNRIEKADESDIANFWMYTKKCLIIQNCLVRGEAYPADKIVSRAMGGRVMIQLNQLKPYLESLATDKERGMALNNARIRAIGAKDVDWSALAAKAAEALKTGMSEMWQYLLTNSTTVISFSETEMTELISALSRDDKLEAKKIIVEAMDNAGLIAYCDLVVQKGKVKTVDNKADIDRRNAFFTGGLAAGLSAMFSVMTGGM